MAARRRSEDRDVGMVEPPPATAAGRRPPPDIEKPEIPDVPPHRHCPLCWRTRHGVGRVYAKQGRKRYLKCDQCNWTWTAVFPIN